MPFWNKNVHFPLDLFFTDVNGKVVSIQHLPAFDEHNFYSDTPYRCVIELNGGMADKLGVKVGSDLKLPGDAMSKAQ